MKQATARKRKVERPVVNPEVWYSLQDIVSGKIFPWATSYWSARNVIARDRKNTNILRALITGQGRATKYQIKGEHIINFITAVEAGQIRL